MKILFFKIYSVKYKNWRLIDEMFKKFHNQDRMKYIKQSTFYNYSIFLIDERYPNQNKIQYEKNE